MDRNFKGFPIHPYNYNDKRLISNNDNIIDYDAMESYYGKLPISYDAGYINMPKSYHDMTRSYEDTLMGKCNICGELGKVSRTGKCGIHAGVW